MTLILSVHLGTAWANPTQFFLWLWLFAIIYISWFSIRSSPLLSHVSYLIAQLLQTKEWGRFLFHQRLHKHRAEWWSLPQMMSQPKERNGSCQQRKQCRNTLRGYQPAWCEPEQCPSSLIVTWGSANTAWRENMQQDVKKLPLHKWCCPAKMWRAIKQRSRVNVWKGSN